ncbi:MULTISPECIES: nucleoside hydrolase [unclassified Paenibacillus]|uniref:nucleoside hydrolase n=1 Tax=unclassified Paenibacillus TaxID=185978 RepID=UPI001C10CC57|nr:MULTISPECIES: nucleoside hydrolase [unclassified Paenibacillus]MBU5445367.1 nucleoside hydrolase [Paenibacillus sp. MSJ-34]CAH0122494.1 Pyrimidine-specific ribonucleoside hydrolase RihA [Paenibacillus sp. CECT 9249]
MKEATKQPIILDVDTGIDDAMAIAYAVRSPELELLGLTTCFGNVTVEEASRNSLQVLEQLDRDDIPVIPGAAEPLFRPPLKGKTVSVHGHNGLGDAELSEPKGAALDMHAAEFIVEQARKRPHEVTVIAVGTMTNMALAIMKDPEIVHLLKRVVIMGGAVTVPGNVTPHAEANIYADPEAAEFLFRSGVPITLVGLDVTMKTLLPRAELANWREKNTKLSRFMADITDYYMDSYTSFYPGILGCALHDPLAVGVVIDPTFVKTKPIHVQVDTEGIYSIGRTVGDLRARAEQEPNMDVCLEVDADRFLQHFLKRIV